MLTNHPHHCLFSIINFIYACIFVHNILIFYIEMHDANLPFLLFPLVLLCHKVICVMRVVYICKIINQCLNVNSHARRCRKIILLDCPISYFALIVKSHHCLVQFSWTSYVENFNSSLLMVSFAIKLY